MFHLPELALFLGVAAAQSLGTHALAVSPTGSDWPRWRGPDGTGVSTETGWSVVGKGEPRWRYELGYGHSSFAVAGGRVYALGHDRRRGLDVVHCLDAESGTEVWRYEHPAEYWNEGHDGGTCTTPAVVGDTVYASNREGKVFAFDTGTGRVRWRRDLVYEYGVSPPQYGFSASPVPVGDLLFLNVGRLVALDRETGATRWLTERHYGNAYSTPREFDYLGTPSLLVLNGEGLGVVDRADGREITLHPFAHNPRHATLGATPIDVEGWIYLSGQHGGGGVMLEPTDQGLEVVWQSRSMQTTHAGCVLFEDHIYGFDRSVLKCIDLDGAEKWRQRGIGLGALSVAGGRLVVIGARGELVIADATPDGYRELSREKVLDGGAFWSTPVLSHGLIYVRNSLGQMVCLDHRRDGVATDTRVDAPSESPPAAVLLARHVEASGGTKALGALRSAHFSGAGQQHMGGPIDVSDAEMLWSAEGSFRLRFASGFEFGITPERGWAVTQHGASMLTRDVMDDMLEAIDFHRVLADAWGYESLEAMKPRVFHDRHCFVVSATRPDGAIRTLYFDSETGLLAAQEGEDTALWTYRDYRERDGVTLPTNISFFWPDSGAMTMAVFDVVTLNGVESDSFDPPEIIVLMNRSDAEKAEANRRLQVEYGYLVGNYRISTGNMIGTPIHIMIQEGGLQYSFGEPAGKYLTEPDEDGHMFDWVNPDLSFQIDRDDSGAMIGLRFFVQGEESGELEPAHGERLPRGQ